MNMTPGKSDLWAAHTNSPWVLVFTMLALLVQPGSAELVPPPIQIKLVQLQNRVFLSWQTQSAVTNTGRTALFPKYTAQVSVDLTNWWDSNLVIPQQVGGESRRIDTNITVVPVQNGVYIRLLSTIDLRGANLANVDWRGLDLKDQQMNSAVMTKALLTESEAEKFWPIYRKYEQELKLVTDRKLALIRQFSTLHFTRTLDEARAKELTERWLKNSQERLDLWKKYQKQFSKAVSPIRAAQFLQVENQMALFIDLNIASEMPAVGTSNPLAIP